VTSGRELERVFCGDLSDELEALSDLFGGLCICDVSMVNRGPAASS
jgi:hypothetical protein